MGSIEDMKKHICQIIPTINMDQQLLMNFLMTHDISYSINNNGIFINISLLSDINITQFYNLIMESMSNTLSDNHYDEEYELYLSEIDKYNEKSITIQKEINYQKLELTDIQKKILTV